ncbi:hypothetical protein AXF42_Ash013857 [Apostasia shenzhenica]|uniref:Uncharacterized protein n=1 Tax=Apostasia shenzhenica TaxID=1088818 RepID=A0A2I0AS21_9ASPA|nr:hypothetical protein AXF42_Ash013857 [Apostasia shenzhenica]
MLLHLPPLCSPSSPCSYLPPRFRFFAASRPPDRRVLPKLPLDLLVSASTGNGGGGGWKLADINPDAVQQRLNSLLLKAQTLLTVVAPPLVKKGLGRKPELERELHVMDQEMFLESEMTVNRRMPHGYLSFAAALSIEQFGRMNGLTGRKMQKIFRMLAPDSIRNDARSLVEYCCFRYLSRDSFDFHPNLKEPAFQRLIFITMLAWELPYCEVDGLQISVDKSSLQNRVSENAFVRIASAIAGVTDTSTSHYLFRALVGDENGLTFSLWITYISELVKIHERRKSYHLESTLLPTEQLLCISNSQRRPVLKWEDNVVWPGNLTLTDSALYFQGIGLKGYKEPIRLDLTVQGSRVDKAKVGPFGSKVFDSAVSVSSGSKQATWVLEFVDFGGELRRDVWNALISEIISLYEFIREYGPDEEDTSIHHVYGAHKGGRRAVSSAANSIARLQSLQYIRKLSEDPAKLVQFSYLKNAPYGDVVLQTLAVNFWGGPLIKKFEQAGNRAAQWSRPSDDVSSCSEHIFDLDGSVYLRKWMKDSKWASSSSVAFWKNSLIKQGIVLGKNLVVGDLNLIERAALTCKAKSQLVEKTQATIDAAMIKGIPSNIDLFKELVLPFTMLARTIDKLRRWEEPISTLSFLAVSYTVIFRNLLPYVLPMTLVIGAATMLLLKALKEQGRLGRSFSKVTICDQPPSNTIQMIVAVKEAMSDLENRLQKLNISLLKLRTIVLAGQPEFTTEVALLLLGAAAVLFLVPFKYIVSVLILDFFTRELEFRREMVMKFTCFVREKWAAVHAAPVVILPYQSEVGTPEDDRNEGTRNKSHGSQSS